MDLFEPARHEALNAGPWNEDKARAAIAAIVDDAHAAYGGVEKLWPIHPIDVSDERPDTLVPLYYGAGGVIWALHHLGAARRDYRPAIETFLARNRADNLKLANRRIASFWIGDAGLLMLHWSLAPELALADALHAAIEANLADETMSFSWGTSGTMHAAHLMHEKTREPRWADLWLRNVDRLWQAWQHDEANDCHLWTNRLYGETSRLLGALHGFAGNAFALLAGKHLLPQGRQDELITRTRRALAATALRDGDRANWELCARPSAHPGMKNIRVQFCTGAPGMIAVLSSLPPDPATDALFLAAGKLTWEVGPLVKLPSLCHGAPGSGYAFLKLHERTGDPIWLDRARAFAMHAIQQNDRFVVRHGQRKYSLWTGDLGLAVYLDDCIRGKAGIPLMDVF